MTDRIIRKIQTALRDEILNRRNLLEISNYFQRLYIEQSVMDNIIKYMDNTKPYQKIDNASEEKTP